MRQLNVRVVKPRQVTTRSNLKRWQVTSKGCPKRTGSGNDCLTASDNLRRVAVAQTAVRKTP